MGCADRLVALADVRFGSLADISERDQGMSALPPKADMLSAASDVRLVPKADITVSYINHQMSTVAVRIYGQAKACTAYY